MEKNKKHLYYLDELSDYKVKSDDPDVRGWKIRDKEGKTIGKVDNLLVNKETEKVVYLDVEVDHSLIEADHKPYSSSAKDGVHEFLNKEGENHLIVPIGLVSLNRDKEIVHTDKIDYRTFAETKRMKKGGTIDRKYEIMVLDSYNRDEKASYAEDESLYERPEYDSGNYRNS